MAKVIKPSSPELAAFYKKEPNFDLLNFDFHDEEKLAPLKKRLNTEIPAAKKSKVKRTAVTASASQEEGTSLMIEKMKSMQRAMRIVDDVAIAEKLVERGYDSANKIAAIPERRFVRLFSPDIDNEDQAIEIHKTATHIAEVTMHLYGNIKDAIASPHYKATNFKTANADMDNYFKQIPSYQELFGSLNYLEGDECMSIFSPAAYFLDIMRITDEYIADPNISPVRTIPPGYTLEERRPDLFDMELTCENTNTVIPYLQLVNGILKKNIEANERISDAYKTLSIGSYPFQLPFNLPLAKTRAYLDRLEMPLFKVFQSIITADKKNSNISAFDVARESLRLSYQQFKLISKQDDSTDGLTAAYGYNIYYQPPAYSASGQLLFLKDQKNVTGVGTRFLSEVKVNDKIAVADEIKTVTAISSDYQLTVDANWNVTAGTVYTVKSLSSQTIDGQGNIAFNPDETKVIGTGSAFKQQAHVGDTIVSAKQSRIIVAIISDTELTIDEAWPLIADGASYTITSAAQAPFQGQGVVVVSKDTVVGMGSNFDTQFKTGDSIDILGISKTVVSIQSATVLTTDSTWDLELGVRCTVTPQRELKKISSYLPRTGTGTLAFSISLPQVKGTGTRFKTELAIGDQIRSADRIRTVTSIASDTDLTVSAQWDIIAEAATFEILPAQGLDIVDNFISHTNLDRTELENLFVQDLSPGELEAGNALDFFINNTKETAPYLQTYFANDPANPQQRIKGITLRRLDRLSRFIRLAKITGWGFQELNWLFQTYHPGLSADIDQALIIYLSKVKTLQESLSDCTVPVLSSFWADMKTIGKVSDKTPEDLFDIVFNNPALLEGKNPYKDDVPFNPFKTPAQQWLIEDINGLNGIVRERLSAALGLDSDNVVMLGIYVCKLTGGIGGTLTLNLSNLSWMYRISQWSILLELSLDEVLNFLCLQYYPSNPYLQPPADCIPLCTETYLKLSTSKCQTEKTGFDVYSLNYVLKGETGPHYEPTYLASEITSFINELAAAATSSRLKPADFVFENTDKNAADFLFEAMTGTYINETGIFKVFDFSYEDAAAYFPVIGSDGTFRTAFRADSFSLTYPDINAEESQKVFDALIAHDLLKTQEVETIATLAPGYTDLTDLSFLIEIFQTDTADFKVSEVRSLLLQCNNAITHTLKVWKDTENKQQNLLVNSLATFISSSAGTVRSLKKYTASASGLSGYLEAFLSSTVLATPDDEEFVRILSRSSLLADNLSLNEKETLYVTSNEGYTHFNIANIYDLSIENVLSLIDYRKLATDFGDVDDQLITYFQLPKDSSCPGPKINKLSAVTGWDPQQLCTIISLYWPTDSDTKEDYDTVAGLVRLQTAFNTAQKLGTDIYTLITFSSIGQLDLAPDGGFSDTNWSIYETVASKSMTLAGGIFDAATFNEVSNAVQGNVDTQTRDALLPFSIWTINANNPYIAKPSDLYNYLLIDVEMSSCGQTSKIAQGIASVQLYMQRCRMMLEPGVNLIDIPKIWWDWMSSYRIWEVNRKIFLYPENYVEPTLRKKVTPAFKDFSDDLLQNELNKDTVQEPYEKYLQQINVLGNLVPSAGYNTTRLDANTGEKKETLFLFGRTNTQPYSYYMRKLDDMEDWGAWLSIDIAINAPSITPVYGFDRIFIFWSEKNVTQSSVVKQQESSTETVEMVDVKYSFYDGKKWVHPQVLYSSTPINAFPLNYSSLEDEQITRRLNDLNASWNIPYVLSVGKGFVGKGKVSISEGLQIISGNKTQFLHEVKKGDAIWCMGYKRIIRSIVDNTTMLIAEAWPLSADDCSYKIIPCGDSDQTQPYKGTGTVTVTSTLQNVSGKGTKFSEEFAYRDNLVVGDQTRMVLNVISDTELIIDSPWQKDAVDVDFTVVLKTNIEEQLIVMLGEDLPTSYDGKFTAPTIEVNPTKNMFITERNNLNLSLYSSLNLADRIRTSTTIKGSVTMGPTQVLDSNLLNSETLLVIADYKYASATNPQPYRANLDRKQASLTVVPDDNLLRNNYWGNNISGTANNSGENENPDALSLLSFTDKEKSSLINVGNQPGWFLYDNADEAFLVLADERLNKLSEMAVVTFMPNYKIIGTQAFAVDPVAYKELKFKFRRITTNVPAILMQKLFAGGINNLLTLRSQEIPELPFNRFYTTAGNTPPKNVIPPESAIMDFNGAYGIYFWEIFFHGPFLIADRLNANKRYEDTKQWLEYIFNPTINEDDSANPDPEKRYWRFRPFRTMTCESLQELLTNPAQIRRYNYDPFDPDAIASYRPVAYAKAIVMKYVDNILDWADLLFAQDTSETINQATNLYILASDLLGKRPESEGKIPTPAPRTFNEIKKQYGDNIPQFLIELENTPEVFSTENQTISFSQVPFNKINSYFNVPENSDFMAYWDKVEDRLFKIRHCQNINGVFRQLALFAPPIDPRAFIRAYASGASGFGLSTSFSAPIPFYRFSFLIDKARSLTAQVSNLGNALLSALEKKDSEAMGLLRQQQEKVILQLTTSIKEMQIQAIDEQIAAQQESLNSAAYRYTYYDKLIISGISQREQVSMDAALAAMILNTLGGITKTAASIGYAVPQVGSPFAMTYGGQQIGNALNAASGAFEIGSIVSSYVSQQSLTMAGYDRRNDDWKLQREIANYDKAQIADQIKQSELQKKIAQQDLVVHLQTIKNSDELDAFYKTKFTNQELYQWMSARISSVYFQAYNLAYNMAKAAERAYQFQYDTDRVFINYAYWDNAYKGLCAAEGLSLTLDQMESDNILDTGYRRLEIEKTVSLLQINPRALLELRSKGECIFELDEKLFDYDFPGHYARKIKTISVSVPAVIGPYQNIHATLTQLHSQLVLKSDKQGLDAVKYLLGGEIKKMPDSSVLRSNWWVNQQIALSKGLNDTGLFELNFEDPRFLPFEGTGAVSTWKLSMPLSTNRINFDAISDVLVQLKYTAKDGGDKFRQNVMELKAFKPYVGSRYLNVIQMYSASWYAFMSDHTSPDAQTLNFDLANFVPPNVNKAKLTGFYFKLDAAIEAPGSYISLKLTDSLSISLQISSDNSVTYSFKAEKKTEPAMDKVIGKCNIVFDLKAAPGGLKNKDGFIDPAVVDNIQLILYYASEAGS